jgi:adenylate kinase
MKRIIILGAPGSGKGSQCKWITKDYNVPHISTGDIFRKNISEGTPLGVEAKKYIDQGHLVPDELTVGLLTSRLDEPDCVENGFLLDGFPRSLSQAEALEKYLEEKGIKIDIVINIDVSDEEILRRNLNRRTCSNHDCKEVYNLLTHTPKVEGICDKCGSPLFIRDDDNELTIKNRLITYHTQTEPLIEYYEKQGILKTVKGQDSYEDTCALVKEALQ